MKNILLGAVAGVALAVTPVVSASADSVADFYKGKTVKLISGGSAGGGFSTVARVLGQVWQKHIPGNPNIIVEAKAGAGGAKMMSYMANAAPKDGTELGAALPIAVNAPRCLTIPPTHCRPILPGICGSSVSGMKVFSPPLR